MPHPSFATRATTLSLRAYLTLTIPAVTGVNKHGRGGERELHSTAEAGGYTYIGHELHYPQLLHIMRDDTVSQHNRDIEKYLAYYCNFPRAPEYAVLLNGPWGAGKTHIIKKFFAERNQKYLYVSLYGMNSLAQIEDALFQQLHPLLASKAGKFAGILLKGIAKATLKIDVDRGKDSEGVDLQLPDLDFSDFFADAQNKVLVFDDLERCEIPIRSVLGYLNHFVEHSECKLIVLANEVEIVNRYGDEYWSTKEKLIGKSFEVQAEVLEALEAFTDRILNKDLISIYKNKRDEIEALFRQSETNNLRILRQTIWDFERFYGALGERHRKNSSAISALFKLFFSLSFELKSGRLHDDDIKNFSGMDWARYFRIRKKAEEPSIREETIKRYPEVRFDQTLLSGDLLTDILGRSIVDSGAIEKSLDQDVLFAVKGEEPPWRTLWHRRTRDDKDIAQALKRFNEQFNQKEFTDPGVILHVAGLRLWLAEVGVIKKPRARVAVEMKKYIEQQFKNGHTAPFDGNINLDHRFSGNTWGGLGFYESDKADFREIFLHLLECEKKALENTYPQRAAELVEEMNSPDLFLRRVCHTNSGENIYAEVGILKFIPVSDFVSKLLALSKAGQETIFMALRSRYERIGISPALQSEKDWLVKVRDVLVRKADRMSPIAKNVLLEWVTYSIDPALSAGGT